MVDKHEVMVKLISGLYELDQKIENIRTLLDKTEPLTKGNVELRKIIYEIYAIIDTDDAYEY